MTLVSTPHRIARHAARPLLVLASALGCCCLYAAAAQAQRDLTVDGFDAPLQNALGGYRGAYAAHPSQASVTRQAVPSPAPPGIAGQCLAIDVQRHAQGYCGAWVHLFDFRATRPRYFDALDCEALRFWVRGAAGGEQFDVRLADRHWVDKEDSVLLGRVTDYLPAGRLTTDWQEVIIPLAKRPELDYAQLGGITLDFTNPGAARVYIDNLGFVERAGAGSRVATASARLQIKSPGAKRVCRAPRSLWVWDTEPLLRDGQERESWLNACEQQNVGNLWMQLCYERPPAGSADEARVPGCTLRYPDAWRSLLRSAHARGLRVFALDGDPQFASPAQHHVPMAIVEAIGQWNRTAPAAERFAGVHLDIEPYLMIGWIDPETRESILREYLHVTYSCQQHARRAGLEFGVDVPFWWHARQPGSDQSLGEVTFRGKRQAASLHCLDLLDHVVVMNYRDVADGPDGILAHARELVAYASQSAKARLYVGVETLPPRPTLVWFGIRVPRTAFREALRGRAKELARLSRFEDVPLHTLDDGHHVHLGLALESTITPATLDRMQRLAALLPDPDPPPRPGRLTAPPAVERHLAHNPEWQLPATDKLLELQRGLNDAHGVTGFVLCSVLPDKVTFGDEPPEWLEQQLAESEWYLGEYPGFAGWALHGAR